MFVSVDPGPMITALVLKYKRRLRELVGDQMFLNDPPHLTVYLAHFAARQRVIQAAAELAAESAAIDINIIGWHVFTKDQLTGGHTLVLQFDEYTQSQLRTFQKRESTDLLRCAIGRRPQPDTFRNFNCFPPSDGNRLKKLDFLSSETIGIRILRWLQSVARTGHWLQPRFCPIHHAWPNRAEVLPFTSLKIRNRRWSFPTL